MRASAVRPQERLLTMNMPEDVNYILNTLEAVGHEAYIVGGCVRDILRGERPNDWDIATSAKPLETKALFPRTVDTGLKHGTVTVLFGQNRYEVTTYRIDGEYLDGRRPESVMFTGQINEDLSRRDFTINAIAYSPMRGFADPFNGRDDISRRIIKCVGEAECRFREDALRMLRAIRFSSVLGFDVDKKALETIEILKSGLTQVSAERIREELGKLLCGDYPEAVKMLETTGLLPYVMRQEKNKSASQSLPRISDNLLREIKQCPQNEPMRLALFLKCTDSDPTKILRSLRFDNKTTKEVSIYARLMPTDIPVERYEIKMILRTISPEVFFKLLDLKEISNKDYDKKTNTIREIINDIIEKNECFLPRDLAVNGQDLMKVGIPPGKQMGETLERLLNAVMREPHLNEKEILIKRAKNGK